ncbi:MAG TPA: cation-translocating P-type ATPase, partial [Thermoanaerobaculia bacterium]|nr:cation-translocating P-type ATPase [Thermoanaerobaculia bacterium]
PPAREEGKDFLFDREDLQKDFVRREDGISEASFVLDGIRCPACLWLNEQKLRSLPGVVEASVSYADQTARVRWDSSRILVSAILAAVREIGYAARPFDPSHRRDVERDATRRDSGRLVFAGAVGMVVMNLALARYFAGGTEAAGRFALWETFARWCELAGSAVLLAYPGQDFFAGAWRDLRRRRLGMDVPIALGLAAAWIGSAWATVRGTGTVYFDAIAMLVFFVLLARAFETKARLKAAAVLDRFAVVRPATARRVERGGGEEEIAALDLSPGDAIRIRPGEAAPADAVILEGESAFDEAVLSGEPWPRPRGAGDPIRAGSVNRDQPVIARVTRTGEASTLGEVRRMLERGLASRPAPAQLADRLAAWLVAGVLAASAATAAWWIVRDSARALPATVAVLIVTCPCALALAAPLALALCAGKLTSIGVLPARMAAIEPLATARTAAFDKTGTLTSAAMTLTDLAAVGDLDPPTALQVAAALEADSPHPLARAIAAACGEFLAAKASGVAHHSGAGVSGTHGGRRWWLGAPEFAAGPAAVPDEIAANLEVSSGEGSNTVVLTDRREGWALLTFREALRPGADLLLDGLRREGIRCTALLSGDSRRNAERLGSEMGFDEVRGAMTPQAKLDWIRSRREDVSGVLFVGDGLNDAPTLAAADVSVSFGEAPQLSRLVSDFVILGGGLSALPAARRIARRSRRLLLQNVAWALAYNVLAVPLAASGRLAPWAAALGMSASSIAVVANAMRLLSGPGDRK